MTRRAVRLVERRTREVRLPRADAQFLLGPAAAVIDAVPTAERGCYRLTPRGFVGCLDGPTRRFVIRPKFPWPDLGQLLGLGERTFPAGEKIDPEAGLLAAIARELAGRLAEVTRAGLVRGYSERDTESPFLRGRLRAADQLRDAATRAFPDRFHVTETVFDLDAAWNRVPKAVGSALLARPDLPAGVRSELAAALTPLEDVPAVRVAEADFAEAEREPRAAHYRALLAICRLVHDGLNAAGPDGWPGGAFLLDLGRAFEQFATDAVTRALASRPGWGVETQPRFEVGRFRGEPLVLQPDVLVRRQGKARVVLDAKWKRLSDGPESDDLHQAIAYAAVTGAGRAVLAYPGRRLAVRSFTAGRVRLALLRLPLDGSLDERRLGLWLRRA